LKNPIPQAIEIASEIPNFFRTFLAKSDERGTPDIEELYLVRPYIVPEGKVGHDAFAVIRETIRAMEKVAIARVVLTNREHIIALEARGKGRVGIGMLLR
jgi:non-homologous end joining protein Ku